MTALSAAIVLTEAGHADDKHNADRSGFFSNLVFEDPLGPCDGKCGVHVYGGQFLDTSQSNVLGVKSFVPPWDYDYGNSGLVGIAFSRRIITGYDSFAIEAEFGAAQRFGSGASATEVWGALFGRWYNFPWNNFVYTTVAVSTGLNYASTVDAVERARSINHSHLLHYFSPEITFAAPDKKDTSLVIRLHHRSGGRILGWTGGIFNGTSGGAQYLTVGIRKNF